jgi:S1-C subfamily serine protease
MKTFGSKATFLLFALASFSTNLIPAARAVDCERPASIQEREDCTSGKTIAKEKFDSQTGLDVVEYLNDLDWKSTDRDKLPWSQIIKLKSALDGSYELIVFDRDYASNFNSGAKEGVITRWSIDTLKGITYTAGGCGFWTCTRERTQVNNLPDSIELFVGSESFKVYGTDGEFAIPQGFINSLKSSGTTKVNLKIGTSTGSAVVPIGNATVDSLRRLFTKGIQSWTKPNLIITPALVSASKLDVEELASRSLPSVVMLKNDRATGSGFVINNTGLILTNRHVVSGPDKRFNVTGPSGLNSEAKVIYIDRKLDFALLETPGAKNIKPLPLCHAAYPTPGQSVVALGSPLGFAGTVTQGIVSAVRTPTGAMEGIAPNYVTLIQTDAAISPGNSGGPLLNSTGEVIGVNTWNIPGSGRAQNINFAISIVDILKEIGANVPTLTKGLNKCGNSSGKK